jgi:hypothetical protein
VARVFALCVAVFVGAVLGPREASAQGALGDWAAIVVAGDYRAAHSDDPTETFDNARRDVGAELIRKGFAPRNVREFSVRPERYPSESLDRSELETISETLRGLARQAPGGCLIYFTSHGSPDGVALGDALLPPGRLNRMVSDACGERPTVVIISACFSGVFVPALARANRMVLTAARADRSSFGCGESDRYPYFDGCMLESLPSAHDFAALGPKVKACVSEREKETGMRPPSKPQLRIGAAMKARLPEMAFVPG